MTGWAPHPGGAPNCGPHVMHEAYSHEVSSAGYWPRRFGRGHLLRVRLPRAGRERTPVGLDTARWDEDLGEFVLPYAAVRTTADPDAALLEFLQSTHEAAAETGNWDRALLERPS